MLSEEELDKILCKIEIIIFDFDGVFTDNTVITSSDGVESVRCWRSDGLGISRLKEVGVRALIISTEKNAVVSQRARKLQIECRQGIDDKADCVRSMCDEASIPLDRVAFVGNDINDIPALQIAGAAFVVADAYPEARVYADFCLSKPGGYGAVRELCDMVWHAKTAQEARSTHVR